MHGYNLQVLDEDGETCKPGEAGNIVIHLPLPLNCLPTLWNDGERFKKSYLSQYLGYYITGDEEIKDKDGYIFVMGWVDYVINVAGQRLSTGQMEDLIAEHPDIAEFAVTGIEDE